MPRYAAFLRGVSPMNAKMPQLKAAFEAAGFTKVKTLLSSGNFVLDSRATSDGAVERKVEAAMQEHLGRTFYTIARRVDELQKMLDDDPFAKFKLTAGHKRVVTFLREEPTATLKLPIEFQGARILAVTGREIFSAYVPQANNPAFMTLIEKTFGKEVTTRTWETMAKCAGA